MKEKFIFTQDLIQKTSPPPIGKRDTYYDSDCKGLVLRVTATGTKSFALQRKIHGEARKITLGTFGTGPGEISVKEARRRAVAELEKILNGKDPQKERNARKNTPTLGEYFKTWMDLYGKVDVSEKTWREKKAAFGNHLSCFASTRLDHLRREQTQAILMAIRDRKSPRTANGIWTIINQIYSQAIEDGVLPANFPIPLHRRFKVPPGRKDFIKPDQMPRFLEAVMAFDGCKRNDSEIVKGIILTALFTGVRRGNILAMRWDEVDRATMTWTIPADKTKTARIYVKRLPDPAQQVLHRMADLNLANSPWVFPQAHNPAKHVTDIKRAWKTVKEAAGLPHLRFHDLRKTFGSYLYLATGDVKLVQMNLDHTDIRVTSEIYAHLDSEERLREGANAGCAMILEKSGMPDPKWKVAGGQPHPVLEINS